MVRPCPRRHRRGRRLASGRPLLALIAAICVCSALLAAPTAPQVRELSEAVEQVRAEHTIRDHWDVLARRLRTASEDFEQRASWSKSERVAFEEAALFVTDPGSPLGLAPAEQSQLLRRAADLAVEHSDLDFGCELEDIVSGEMQDAGLFAAATGRLRLAIERYRDAPSGLVLLYRRLVLSECFSGELSAAARTLERGFEQCEREERAGNLSRFQRGMLESARVLWLTQMGLTDHAARAFERERSDLEGVDNPTASVQLVFDANMLDFAVGTPGAVIARTLKALEQDPPIGMVGPLWKQLVNARVELSETEPAEVDTALAAARQAIAIVGSSHPARVDFLLAIAELERVRGEHAAVQAALDEIDALGPHNVNDSARLAAIRSSFARGRGASRSELESCLAEIEATFARMLSEWASAPERPDGLGYQRYGSRRDLLCESIAVRRDLFGETRAAEAAIADLIAVQELGSLHRRLGLAGSMTVERVRAGLCTDRRGVLIIVQGGTLSFAITLDARSSAIAELPPWFRWRKLHRRWVALLTEEPSDERALAQRRISIPAMGAQLAEMLLPPELVARLEGWDGLAIVGWDWFGYLPFESLPFGESDMGQRFAMCYLPSLPVGCSIAERPANRSKTLAVIGAPTTPQAARDRGWNWPDIVWSEAREARLARLCNDLRVRSGLDATLEALRELCTESTAVLEVIAHGFYDNLAVPPAGFGLASTDRHDGLVRATDLVELRAPPLVVLAVCGAARGPLRSGDDGIGHLGGSFLAAGADVVAVSHADLRQDSAERIVDLLYDGCLSANNSPAVALRDARRALVTRDPFERDLVHLVGFGFRPLHVAPRPASTSRGSWIAVIAGVGVVALVVAVVRRNRTV